MSVDLKYSVLYLPYEVNVDMNYSNNYGTWIKGIKKLTVSNYKILQGHSKLVLRPLSQLTEPIEHNGEIIIVIDIIRKLGLGHVDYITTEREGWIEDYGIDGWVNRIPYGIINILLYYHFDIYGLNE